MANWVVYVPAERRQESFAATLVNPGLDSKSKNITSRRFFSFSVQTTGQGISHIQKSFQACGHSFWKDSAAISATVDATGRIVSIFRTGSDM